LAEGTISIRESNITIVDVDELPGGFGVMDGAHSIIGSRGIWIWIFLVPATVVLNGRLI
jgi:hypothetical protein